MRSFRSVPLLCLLVLARPAGADVRIDRLRADWAALQGASRDYRQRAATLSRREASDYRAYIDRLHRRLADGCLALRAADVALPADIDCPQATPRIAPANIDQDAEQTSTDATATLDAELNTGLGEFDQRLLREQERVKAKASRPAGQSTVGAGGEPEAGEAGAMTGSSSAADRGDADSTLEPPPGTAGGPKGEQSASVPPPPADVPDGRDDDVVARQLREAAEKETDPELRKKLWDEYRRYKQGVR